MRTFLAAALAAAVIAAARGDDEKDKKAKELLAQIEEKAKAAGASKDAAERDKLYGEMIKLAQDAEKLDDKNPAVPFALGSAHAAKREHGESVAAFKRAAKLAPDVPVILDRLGDAQLKNGEFGKAVESFDAYLKKVRREDYDAASKNHWRRGIALYYAGKYDEGAKQFEIHHEVNKEDVENSVWNYACLLRREVAAGKDAKEAKPTAAKGLFDAKGDGREPLQAVLETFKNTKEDATAKVVAAIDKFKKDAKASAEDKKEAEFYGNLYIALYYDAEKNHDACKKYLEQAVGKDKAEREKKAIGHYMWDVAVAHLDHFDALKARP